MLLGRLFGGTWLGRKTQAAAAVCPITGLLPGILSPGMHLVSSRRGYLHHGIYVGGRMVVHYAGLCQLLHSGPVEEVTLSRFSMGRAVRIVEHDEPRYSHQEIARRARSRLGENEYHVLRNNCEHFCNWCISGRSRSPQAERPLASALQAFLLAVRCAIQLPLMLGNLRAPPAGRREPTGPAWRVASAVVAICVLASASGRAFAGSATVEPEPAAALHEPRAAPSDFRNAQLDPLLSDLEQRTFRFFWETANPKNGLVPDRYPTPSYASIAAVGFGLTAYPIGVERAYISRTDAQRRVLATLRYFAGASNQHGFFYHFVDMRSGARAGDSEVSTVDTALLLAGMLFCENYFDTRDPRDVEIRKLTDEIYRRVDWTWAQPRPPAVALAWTPETGFSQDDWRGYNEAMLVYLLALGSPTHPIERQAWMSWTSTYDQHWGTLYGQTYLSFGPAFGHQYTHVWVDFRGIRDAYMREHGLDYFENSRRATYTQRRYAIANPKHWQGYSRNVWGMSASDGPGISRGPYLGEDRTFLQYAARGVGLGQIVDDGTIAPTAAISSLPFAPEIVLPATLEMYRRFGSSIYSSYGFLDAFNASASDTSNHQPAAGSVGWVDSDYLGIDEGPILAMIENYRSDLVWRVMRGDPYLQQGLERAGFSGGWLAPLAQSRQTCAAPGQYADVAGSLDRSRAKPGITNSDCLNPG